MTVITEKPLSEVQREVTKEELEQGITELELAILELKAAMEGGGD